MTRPSGARSKASAGTPKERKMALKHRTTPSIQKHFVFYELEGCFLLKMGRDAVGGYNSDMPIKFKYVPIKKN